MIPETRLVGNMALLPLKTQFKGPARGDGEAVWCFFSSLSQHKVDLCICYVHVWFILFAEVRFSAEVYTLF